MLYEMHTNLFSLASFLWHCLTFSSMILMCALGSVRCACTCTSFHHTVYNGRHHTKSCGREIYIFHSVRFLMILKSGRKNQVWGQLRIQVPYGGIINSIPEESRKTNFHWAYQRRLEVLCNMWSRFKRMARIPRNGERTSYDIPVIEHCKV